MIAIFNNKKDASDYSDLIHTHLIANRPEYNAVRWSDINKSDKVNEWAVKIPSDLNKLNVKIKKNHLKKSIRQIEKYPDDWESEVEV